MFSLISLSGQYLLYCGVSALQSVLNLISLTVICFSSLLMIQMNSTGLSISKHLCHFSYFKVTVGKVFYTFFFCFRWEAGQVLARKLMLSLVGDFQQGKPLVLNPKFVQGLRSILGDSNLDKVWPVFLPHLPPLVCEEGGGRRFTHQSR